MIGHSLDAMGDSLNQLKGLSLDDAAKQLSRMKGVTIDDALRFLSGKEYSAATRLGWMKDAGGLGAGTKPGLTGRFAGTKLAKQGLRIVPGLSVGLAAMDVGDVITNDTSLANKAMDATAMGIGGALGSVAGPVGTAAGISTGKFLSDGTQWLFGDKKSPEQRRMEEALIALQNRGLV